MVRNKKWELLMTSTTIRLPQSLLDQVRDSQPSSRRHHSVARGSRKASRKQGRALKKQNKAHYFSNEHKSSNPNLKRNAEREHSESPNAKKARADVRVGNARNSTTSAKSLKRSSEDKAFASSPKKKTISLPKATSKLEEEEEAYIAHLESKLGLGKTRKKKSSSEEDGLDDLLNFADSIIPTLQDIPSDNMEDSEDSIEDSESEQSSFHDSTEVWNGISQDDGNIGPGQTQKVSSPPKEAVTLGSAGRYVPPHLRNSDQDDNNSEAIQKLTRHLKGLLNRMSEQNITTIITSVEGLYREYRRHDITSTLTTLIINSISSHSSLLDSFVVVYAAFVSSLHKIIGIDFAAHFVQHTVASYEQYNAAMQVSPPAPSFILEATSHDIDTQKYGKECSNLLVLVSELYNFQVISSVLVFDMIRDLLDGHLTEFKVELLLKLLRNSGQQLRQDDPSALKDIIGIVQGKVATRNEAVSSRTTFMLETLTNLKNNKLKRNVTQNQGGAAVERMKKYLTNLSKTRHVVAHEPLRVSLEDLRSANSKGKWWLVGAGWGGDPLIDKQAGLSNESTISREIDTTQDQSAKLAQLARAQGMNTEIRRGIFIVLMSSDDYIDACERLSQLNLTEIQQREIVRVILHCCGNEKLYNPYYTLVCQQLCRISHAYKITLQYCIWDFLRDLGETNVGGAAVIKSARDNNTGFELQSITHIRLHNVAKAYGWWIAKDSVSLLVLKPVDFTVLRPRTHEFLKELMVQVFLNSQRSMPLVTQDTANVPFTRNRNAVEEIFIKASRIQSLAMGLVYFLSEAFQDVSNSDDDGYSKFMPWAVGTAKATLRTGIDVVTVL